MGAGLRLEAGPRMPNSVCGNGGGGQTAVFMTPSRQPPNVTASMAGSCRGAIRALSQPSRVADVADVAELAGEKAARGICAVVMADG